MLTKYGDVKCDYCGKFISYSELEKNDAVHRLLTPDSDRSAEEYESFHRKCETK